MFIISSVLSHNVSCTLQKIMPPARDIQDKPAKIPYLTKPLPIPDIPMYYSVISSDIILNNHDLLDKPV